MVEFDEGILQSSKALLEYETTVPLRVKAALKRDLSEAIEIIRVKEEANLDYETYKKLKVSIGFVTRT